MAVQVEARNPRIYVTMILSDGTLVTAAQTRPVILEVVTKRRLGDAGSFQLTFTFGSPPPPISPVAGLAPATWYQAVMPMDYVEIAIDDGSGAHTVMRGLVDSVNTAVDNRSGTPRRQVTIIGRDFTKILLNTKLYTLTQGTTPQFAAMEQFNLGLQQIAQKAISQAFPNFPAPAPPLGYQASATAPQFPTSTDTAAAPVSPFTPEMMMQLFTQYFLIPQQRAIFGGITVTVPLLSELLFDGTGQDPDEGQLSTFPPQLLGENTEPFVSLMDLYQRYTHAPWRELFFDDYDDNSYLIYRPTPWLDINGKYITYGDPAGTKTVREIDIPDKDIISYELSRSDTQVANVIESLAAFYGPLTLDQEALGSTFEALRSDTNPAVISEGPSNWKRYGFRLRRVETPYFDLALQQTADELGQNIPKINEFAKNWNKKLTAASDHDEFLETGSVILKGNTSIHIGHYIRMGTDNPVAVRPPGSAPRYYVEGVTHTFTIPSTVGGNVGSQGSFETEVEVTRGRGFLARALQYIP